MLTSKQRAFLRGKAQALEAIFQIGKSGVSPEVVAGVSEALAARELVKISILQNCEEGAAEVAEKLSARTRSEVVQVIGRRVVLYKAAKEPKIELPKVKKGQV